MVDDDLVHQLNDLDTAQDYRRFLETQYASSELSTQLKLFQKIRNLHFTNIDNYLNTLLKLRSQFQAFGTAMSNATLLMLTLTSLPPQLQASELFMSDFLQKFPEEQIDKVLISINSNVAKYHSNRNRCNIQPLSLFV